MRLSNFAFVVFFVTSFDWRCEPLCFVCQVRQLVDGGGFCSTVPIFGVAFFCLLVAASLSVCPFLFYFFFCEIVLHFVGSPRRFEAKQREVQAR